MPFTSILMIAVIIGVTTYLIRSSEKRWAEIQSRLDNQHEEKHMADIAASSQTPTTTERLGPPMEWID